MTRIAIFGVGLIGGSLALCFKGKPGITVVGHSIFSEEVEKYRERQVVDIATTSMEEAAADADFIFLCVPVSRIHDYLEQLSQYELKPGCIITDVGSTKASIVELASRISFNNAVFIGGHPMAGSERSGVEAASSILFENAYYVLTPAEAVDEGAFERLAALLLHTRAQIVRVEPKEHDDIVGAISHLPHLIACALVNQVRQYNDENSLYQLLAAGGFRDITRIASCDPNIWRDILLSNKSVLLRLLKDWNGQVQTFISFLQEENGQGIYDEFTEAGAFRRKLPERRKGMISTLYDVYVNVPDTPGIIGRVATELGNHKLNLSNIEIIESRLDIPGVLRLSFRNEDDWDRAQQLLRSQGFTVSV